MAISNCCFVNFFMSLTDSTKTANTKVRRSLISVSNKSLSIEDVRSEITRQFFNKLKPASLWQPLEKVCVPGPPEKKKKGAKDPEEDEEYKVPRVKRECKASRVYLVDAVSEASWEIKEEEEKRVKR